MGTGPGLYISKGYVEALGGKMAENNSERAWCDFLFFFAAGVTEEDYRFDDTKLYVSESLLTS